MAHLSNIISELEKKFHTSIENHMGNMPDIDAICFLKGNCYRQSFPQKNVLYAEYTRQLKDDLSQLRAIPELQYSPLLLIGGTMPEGTSVPGVLHTPDELPLMEVFNTVQEEILRYHRLKDKREELFHSLHSGYGLSSLAHVAHSFLGNPITICDTSFSIIAASPAISDKQNLEEKCGRLYLREPYFQNMLKKKIVEHIYTSTQPYLTMLDEYYPWVFQPVRIHHAAVGYICVRGTVRPFTEDDLEFINIFAQMVSIEMQKDATYVHPTGQNYEYFLTELLDGHLSRTDYIIPYLIRLGRPLAPYYTLMLLLRDSEQRQSQYFKSHYDQLLSILPGCMVALFRGELTVLLPSSTHEPFSEYSLERFQTFLKLNQMQACISYSYTNIGESTVYYQQVRELADMVSKDESRKSQPMVYYKDCFFEHLLQQLSNKRMLKASVHPDILHILDYDQQNNTEYATTLHTYLTYNQNATLTAAKLHIHKSTFFYRLGKMQDLFNLNLNDTSLLFAYDYSFRVLQFLQ